MTAPPGYNAQFGQGDWRVQQKNGATALFTHVTVPLVGPWTLSGGARMERMTAHLLPPEGAQQKHHWSPLSPKLALQYQFSPQQHAYLSASRGVRTGGFNTLSPRLGYRPFTPEKLWSWEAGFKGHTANGRMRYTLAAYWMDIKDMQVMQMPMPGTLYITNAATAQSKGVDIDLEWYINGQWQWRAGLAYNRTRFDHFMDGNTNYSGQHNPFAPALTGHMGLRHTHRSGWYTQVSLRGSSTIYLDAANSYRRNGYGQLDMSSGFAHGAWDVSVYAKNINNTNFDAVGYQNGFVTVYSPPREIGLRIIWKMQ